MTLGRLIAIIIVVFAIYGIWMFFSTQDPVIFVCLTIIIAIGIFIFKGKHEETNSSN